MAIEEFSDWRERPNRVANYSDALRVLRHRQVMKPELVAEAAILVQRVTLAGMTAFAVALPRNPVRPQLHLPFGGQA